MRSQPGINIAAKGNSLHKYTTTFSKINKLIFKCYLICNYIVTIFSQYKTINITENVELKEYKGAIASLTTPCKMNILVMISGEFRSKRYYKLAKRKKKCPFSNYLLILPFIFRLKKLCCGKVQPFWIVVSCLKPRTELITNIVFLSFSLSIKI